MALFAKAGGGIYTKTADIGADLVGKVEIGIPEDDPRNPAVIADNVGDNVGDVAGMGADLFASYVASIVAAMILGATSLMGTLSRTLTGQDISFVILPLLLAGMGIFASIVGMLFMKVSIKSNPGAALNRGTYITCIIFAIFAYVMVSQLGMNIGIFYATLAGLVAGMVIGMTTDFFTSIDRTPVKKTAESAKTGPAINILSGFSYGLISIVPPIIGICAATIVSWNLASIGLAAGTSAGTIMQTQIYGLAISAVGMLSIVGMIVSADAYGPIVDNAKGIAEQAGIGKEFVDVADKLDAAGNTAKAITKGFAIGAAALTVIALFVVYAETVGIQVDPTTGLYIVNIFDPKVLAGIFLGAMMPPLISALLILGVGRNAFRMVEEIRRQFKEIPGLLELSVQGILLSSRHERNRLVHQIPVPSPSIQAIHATLDSLKRTVKYFIVSRHENVASNGLLNGLELFCVRRRCPGGFAHFTPRLRLLLIPREYPLDTSACLCRTYRQWFFG